MGQPEEVSVGRVYRRIILVAILLSVVACANPNSSGSSVGGYTRQLVSQSFVDANNGWALAAECPDDAKSSASFACRSIVYGTSDGGQNWATDARVLLTPKQFRFVDRQTGWLIGSIGKKCGPSVCPNVVMLSVDGGKTWNRVSTVSGELLDLAALSGNDAWAVGRICSDAVNCHAELVKTTTAGQIWDNREVAFTGRDVRLERAGTSAGWVGGTVEGGTGPTLFATVDAGSSWSPLTEPCQGGSTSFDFINPSVGWLICFTSGTKADQNGIGQAYRTSDGGQTWSRLGPVTGSPAASPVAATQSAPSAGLRFVSADQGWLALTDGRLFATADGGQTWRKAADLAPGLVDLTFFDSTNGWALGVGQIWRTRDSGASWTPVSVIS
jgi:photosystem II stability/assembly factor-like uncharacterized protein